MVGVGGDNSLHATEGILLISKSFLRTALGFSF